MLSNAYFLAKFHFDTAENEPAKKLQNIFLQNFPKKRATFAICVNLRGPGEGGAAPVDARQGGRGGGQT